MNILISQPNVTLCNGKVYKSLTIQVDTKTVIITKAPGYINVNYRNAMSVAWRGLGRDFDSFELALQAYKDKKIITAIETAKNEL